MKRTLRLILTMLLALALCAPAFAEEIPANPLLEPYTVTEYTDTQDDIMTLLILGTDFEYKDYARDGGDMHTDAMMVVVVNRTKGRVDLLSVPRDTFSYVAGYRGIFKANCAIDCGGRTQWGFQTVCDTVSRLIGGVKIDYYCSVDFDTMVRIGDAIGGVDFDVDVSFSDSDLHVYCGRGMQHMDGKAITAYMRARMNASGSSSDANRVARQRKMIAAILQQTQAGDMLTLIPTLFSLVGDGLYTNLTVAAALQLASALPTLDMSEIGMYSLSGTARYEMSWKFNFIDQDARIATLQTLFGIQSEPLPYCSYEYAGWLKQTGLLSVRYLYTAAQVIEASQGLTLTAEQKQTLSDAVLAREQLEQLFRKAAYTMAKEDTSAMAEQRKALKTAVEALAKGTSYAEKRSWEVASDWTKDPAINEIYINFR